MSIIIDLKDTDSIVASVIHKLVENGNPPQTFATTLDWIQHAQNENRNAILYLEQLKQKSIPPPPPPSSPSSPPPPPPSSPNTIVLSRTVTTDNTIVASIAHQFVERAAFGKRKYGTTLERNDLTMLEWIQHAQEEHMDAILYLEKLRKLGT